MSDEFSWTDDEFIDDEPQNTDGVIATLPWGTTYKVLNVEEKEALEKSAKEYVDQNHLVNIADFQDLERLVALELITKRYNQWMMQEHDYNGEKVDIKELQKYVKEYSAEIRGTKKSLNLDKAGRDKAKGENTADYIYNLGIRAKNFLKMRNEQFIKAITLWKELEGLINFHDNADEDERKEFKKRPEDIIEWIREKIPEFNAIDEAYRENDQRFWIRSQ